MWVKSTHPATRVGSSATPPIAEVRWPYQRLPVGVIIEVIAAEQLACPCYSDNPLTSYEGGEFVSDLSSLGEAGGPEPLRHPLVELETPTMP